MKLLAVLAATAALFFTADPATAAPTNGERAADPIPNKYIVTLKPGADATAFTRALKAEVAAENARESGSGSAVTSAVDREFAIGANFVGYAGTFTPSLAQRLAAHAKVAAVEPDAPVYAAETESETYANPPSWGLARISQRAALNLTAPALYYVPGTNLAGEGVSVYIADTGINTDTPHSDFQGRAWLGFKADPAWSDNDGNGHGTHVASTIGGHIFGASKRVNLIAVKVLGDDGSGTNAGVIAGINYVAAQAKAAGQTVILNLSLGGGKSLAVNAAIEALYKAGGLPVVAAGNSGADACRFSPASAPSAITVAASTKSDTLASYSNYGAGCVDIIAPGSAITGAWNDGGNKTISGTSMASPHVAAGAALFLAEDFSLTPAQITAKLLAAATTGKIANAEAKGNTPNKLLYVGEEAFPQWPKA
ncbi:hypothetical protein H9P43_009735 [Blastocladiella emersonii ATCC 22665]|nr:hypothetical protein H9P43_009735 [Blastocladiella emersonii ATCC 22665]